MGRVNKFTAGVFTDIVGDQKETSAINQFLNIQTLLKTPTKVLTTMLNKYKAGVEKNKISIEMLAKLEDVIMQMRTRDNLTPADIKLNVVREYIYARIPFHRKDKDTKDIRVIVGQTEVWGTDPTILLGNENFMAIAKEKLTSAMNAVIFESNELVKNYKP